jgi:dolichyl-phosphate beta-glucosyltransferase
MDLSIIIPIYNAEDYVVESAQIAHAYLSKLPALTYEIIFVDDGSQDHGAEKVLSLALPATTVLRLPCNLGKFGAICAGMSAAKGRCRIFTDGDVPYELESIGYIADLILARDFHLVIGDRTLPGSEYSQQLSFVRSVVTKLFTFFVRMLVAGGLFDTQCGIKGFRADVAKTLFPLVRDKGFSGDVELLYIALKYNLEIKRVPVRLRRQAPSSVKVVRHGLSMLRRISRLRRSWRRGYYHSEELVAIADQSYWNNQSIADQSVAAPRNIHQPEAAGSAAE